MAGYVVNPGGAVHSVEDEQVEALLGEGFRLATEEEIITWWEMQGFHAPVEDPFESDADGEKPAKR